MISEEKHSYEELYRLGKGELESAGISEAELDARLLLEHVCGTNRNDLLVHGDREVAAAEQNVYERLLAGRKERIPLQQLTGRQEFMGLEFAVNEHVLIPRQDTEILVEEVLRNLYDGMRILDLCTGSGCILISLLHYSNDCEGVGTDISAEALDVARQNAQKLLGIQAGAGDALTFHGTEESAENRDGRISFIQGDLFEKVEGKFDIIVSNPPYICRNVIETLMPEVREHEPLLALDGGEDGISFYRRIMEECGSYLCGGGMLFLEIGYDQAADVRKLMEDAGFLEVSVVKDYGGQDRVVYGTKPFA
ncbi:peptide chain release factor N(5)-glutamine methyltransferase [Acetatifactor aquisgranensis]|uniref:peptide chain release factor N(5)-glutamine methyltransferase n=1 Tax=Acetatifactor aquisgranensis TaxID=2941233 RepID=UPI00203DC2E5|nr:peptide chain release factor N(5)-glutamine methyltransferase [Acetatifactor aquisgranensis]